MFACVFDGLLTERSGDRVGVLSNFPTFMEIKTKIQPMVRVKRKFQVTIPNRIREQLHLEVGDLMEAGVSGGTVILRPKAVVDRDVEQDIHEGLEDIARRRTIGPFKSVAEFKAAIKKYEVASLKKSAPRISRASSKIAGKRG